jgi:CHAT domain-containing protein
VADSSTQLLMDDFYKDHSTGASAITKAAALQDAQLTLLHGMSQDSEPTNAKTKRDIDAVSSTDSSDQPKFTPDPKAPFAHPFYWAPFVLIGNWK